MKGTTPEGARTEREAAAWVREMFGRVAHRYDFANHLLSFNMDRRWRAHTVRTVREILERPRARILDICCGTGDLLLALAVGRPEGNPVLGADFSHPMLLHAREKIENRQASAFIFESDALNLPLRNNSLDLVTAAFGFRNLANYERGLSEIYRVLRRGGKVAILEFSQPKAGFFGSLYVFYSRRILPWIGGAISGNPDAYRYLPESVRKFPSPEDLAKSMRAAGFAEVHYELLTGGIVALHIGTA